MGSTWNPETRRVFSSTSRKTMMEKRARMFADPNAKLPTE
jgi:hypothetical protein